ncbi:MAG: hypothetical protein LUC95_05925 [Lachnospiraceae bacterium]|nr:hypothetical protein [Lachnospiraceae bacterium]
MTKKERLLNAFHNQPVDKVPMGFWYHFSPDEDLGQETIDQHLALYRDTDMDMIKVMCDGYFNYPNPYISRVTCAKDWYGLTPLGEDHPFIAKQVERAKGVVDAVHGECCVFYNVFCPMSQLRFGTSEELLMRHIKEDPDAVCHAFEVIAQDTMTLIRKLITEAGCDGIYYCVQNAEKFRFSAEEYRRLVTPAELTVLEYANSLSDNNILHCCGWAGDANRIEVWQDYPARAVNWAVYVENMTLSEGKKFFGDRCVLGGFDNRKEGILYAGTPEQIEAETVRLINEAGTRGVVLGADCTLPSDIDHERLRIVRRTLDRLADNL